MADVDAAPAAPTEATPKKAMKKTTAARRSKSGVGKAKKPTHPSTAVMVSGAIKALKERGGSSLQAIKKYVAATYKVDADKLAPFIKKYLKASVASGQLIQTKGKGASGSFKLPGDKATTRPKAARKTDAVKAAAAPKAAAASPKAKKKIAAKAKRSPSKKAAAKPASKAKKTTKPPTKKPKSPKAKTAKPKAAAAKSARRAAPKKK